MKHTKLILLLALIGFSHKALSQGIDQIAELEFLVGNWEGPGTTYLEDGSTKEYFDTEFVRFDLDKRLLLINAKGTLDGAPYYQLHTIIYFDAEAGHYIYTPYSGGKPSSFTCNLTNKRFICLNSTKDYRLTFQRTQEGLWNEFGERLEGDEWLKRFETILEPSSN